MTDDTDNVIKLKGRKRPKRGEPGFNANGPGIGGPANGSGWGGEAKGAGKGPEALPPGSKTSANIKAKADRVAFLEDVLFDIAADTRAPGLQVQAAAKLHAIYEGTPVQRVIKADVDTVEELRSSNPVDASREYQRIIGGKTIN